MEINNFHTISLAYLRAVIQNPINQNDIQFEHDRHAISLSYICALQFKLASSKTKSLFEQVCSLGLPDKYIE